MFWGRVFIACLASVGIRAAQEGSGAGSAGSGCTRQQILDTCVYFPSLPNLQANTHPRAKMLLAETAWEISAHPHPGGGGVKQRGWEQQQDTRSLPPSRRSPQLCPRAQGLWAPWGWGGPRTAGGGGGSAAAAGAQAALEVSARSSDNRASHRTGQNLKSIPSHLL